MICWLRVSATYILPRVLINEWKKTTTDIIGTAKYTNNITNVYAPLYCFVWNISATDSVKFRKHVVIHLRGSSSQGMRQTTFLAQFRLRTRFCISNYFPTCKNVLITLKTSLHDFQPHSTNNHAVLQHNTILPWYN